MTTNDCKGCNAYNTRAGICCGHAFNGGTCPCTICIVKMICVETCDVFEIYAATRRKRDPIVKQGDNYGQH